MDTLKDLVLSTDLVHLMVGAVVLVFAVILAWKLFKKVVWVLVIVGLFAAIGVVLYWASGLGAIRP